MSVEGEGGHRHPFPTEMMTQVVQQCGWWTLVTLSHVSSSLRILAMDESRWRIETSLYCILSAFSLGVGKFLDVLHKTSSAVTGSLASACLRWGMKGHCEYDRILKLTVAVPHGLRQEFMDALSISVGWEEVEVWREARSSVASVWIAQVMDGIKPLYIKVIESTGTCIQALISSPTTEDMVFITSSRLYILYPQLVRRNMAFSTIRWNNRNQLRSHPNISDSNSTWDFDCRWQCPEIWRHDREGEGIAAFFWNKEEWCRNLDLAGKEVARWVDPWNVGSLVRDGSRVWLTERERFFIDLIYATDVIGGEGFKWTLGRRCDNGFCTWRETNPS
ncbi:hypothetical protein BKA70DRAFT_1202726 [Coprinopsis sp. MPI-PUGE-AT-0042]|nr:hypothetical protein BKA70DRAFT_1202726 [Coprinopsis sp. MPI-PUGE-AT-0042]